MSVASKGVVNPRKGHYATIAYITSGAGNVTTTLYDTQGREVWKNTTYVSGTSGSVTWEGRDSSYCEVGSGIYIVRIEGPGLKTTKKVAVVK